MTTEQIIESVETAIEDAAELSRLTGIIPTVKFEGVPYDVFEHFRDEVEAETRIDKCSCGSCGSLVVAFTYAVLNDTEADEELDDEHKSGALVAFVRSATEEETIAELERMIW